MGDMTDVVIEIDEKVKVEADKVFSSLGFNLEEAINLFLKAVVEERKMPFSRNNKLEEM